MFIYNIKLNGSKLFKILLSVIILFVVILCCVVAYRLYKASTIKVNDNVDSPNVSILTNHNYSTILKASHENLDQYVGKEIKFSGFVYRVYDLNKEQFILGRNMIISSDFQSVVVGFLCHYKDAIDFKDNSWVEITGSISKGTYHNDDMPILEITSIHLIEKPQDEYVYPPDENYIPTSVIL